MHNIVTCPLVLSMQGVQNQLQNHDGFTTVTIQLHDRINMSSILWQRAEALGPNAVRMTP